MIPFPRRLLVATALLAAMLVGGLGTATTVAHAELRSADPPVDGLAVTSPDVLTLHFTEEVELNAPAPVIVLLDQQGSVVGSEPLPIVDSEDPRTLVVDAPDLGPGPYTVSWSVTSATDGHHLSGSYAFRVGGGLPPGLATTEHDRPAPWAVASRWLTFLGASIAAGFLLFPLALLDGHQAPVLWTRLRGRIVLAAAAVALLASLAEPLLQWLLTSREAGVSLGGAIEAMPDNWRWRPWLLAPLTLLAFALMARRGLADSRPASIAGAALALGSLAGLVLTSHSAGRESWRELAIASNFVHQWAVATWTGGLAAIGVWGIARSGDPAPATLRWSRFSSIALVLFVVALVSGSVNTTFVFGFLTEILDDGFSFSVFRPLWSSNYGFTLIVKLLLLVIPFALAVANRQLVQRLASDTVQGISALATRLHRSVRIELIAVALVIAGGSTLALSAPPIKVDNVLDQITLVSATGELTDDGSLVVQLTVDPADTGENTIIVRLTDWNGQPLPADPAPRVTLDFTSLDHGTVNPGVALQPGEDAPDAFATHGLLLSLDGWWQIDARVQRAGYQNAVATFYALLPDPNTQGFDAPPSPTSEIEAESLFARALVQMTSWERVRWTEDLGSGQAAFVRARFAVVDGQEVEPDAWSLDLVYSASFATRPDGSPPAPPSFDTRSSITIGDQGWLRTTRGIWLSEPPTRFTTPSGWDSTYAGSDHFRLGSIQDINGRTLQVVTFYLPEQESQSEAWFAWWIDIDTGDVAQVAMIARQHYMVWQYFDIDGDFSIDQPATD